jgi:hypothetical protein
MPLPVLGLGVLVFVASLTLYQTAKRADFHLSLHTISKEHALPTTPTDTGDHVHADGHKARAFAGSEIVSGELCLTVIKQLTSRFGVLTGRSQPREVSATTSVARAVTLIL